MKKEVLKRSRFALAALLFAALIAILPACSSQATDEPAESADAGASAEETGVFTVTDLAGRDVELVNPISRALAIAGPAYEKVFLLGQTDKLAGAHFYMVDRPWVKATNPDIGNIAAIESPGEPNVEALLALDPDVALFFDYEEPLAAMEDADIPVVVVQNSSGNPTTADEFIDYQKKEVEVFADVFGAEAQAKAQEWFDYFDEKVAYVQSKVGDIPEAERKTALYAYGEEGLGVFSLYSYPSFWLELAGGKNIADESGAEMDTLVTLEQIVAWDPDFYFMGRMESTEPVTSDAKWASLKAVKNGNVYLCPDGVMYWDYSSEGVLLMEYLAQKMYPELFSDLDMKAEVQEYYAKFYNYDLSDEDAERLLNHQAPVGYEVEEDAE